MDYHKNIKIRNNLMKLVLFFFWKVISLENFSHAILSFVYGLEPDYPKQMLLDGLEYVEWKYPDGTSSVLQGPSPNCIAKLEGH